MPTLIYIDSSPNAQEGIDVASDNDKVSGKRKIDVDQNESTKRQSREEGETMPKSIYIDHLEASSRNQCWPCSGISSDSNHKEVSKEKKGPEKKRREKKMCPTPGCTRLGQIRGHCKKHDPEGGYICKHTGCSNICRYKGTHCGIHSTLDERYRLKKCKIPGCWNQKHARGLCKRHDPLYAKCKKDNCFLQAKLATTRGFCSKHDPHWNKCQEDNCDNTMRARGRCRKHDKIYREKEKREKEKHSEVVI